MVDHRNPYRNIPEDECNCGGKNDRMHSKHCPYRDKPDPFADWPYQEVHRGVGPKANDRQVGGDHYKSTAIPCPHCGKGIEHWDLSWAGKWDQFQYNVTKYLLRWRHKYGLNDLRKAQHHLEKYIEVLEAEDKKTPVGPVGS